MSTDPAAASAAAGHGRRNARSLEGIRLAGDGAALPKKRFFRQRAHVNPLSFGHELYPISPERMDWSAYYPATVASAEEDEAGDISSSSSAAVVTTNCALHGARVEVADVGCGFGGLLLGLAPILPRTLCLGLEIRVSVAEYVRLRILALRRASPGAFDNISVLNANTMKYLLNFVEKGQLSKMFFCFPDPHFKKSKHRRRIVSTPLLAEYAYFLREGGRLYTITDVLDLHNWMAAHADAHPAFERIPDAELADDPCVAVMRSYTEEGKKVERLAGDKYVAVFRRLPAADALAKSERHDFWTEPPVAYKQIRAVKSKMETVPGLGRTKRVRLENGAWGTDTSVVVGASAAGATGSSVGGGGGGSSAAAGAGDDETMNP